MTTFETTTNEYFKKIYSDNKSIDDLEEENKCLKAEVITLKNMLSKYEMQKFDKPKRLYDYLKIKMKV